MNAMRKILPILFLTAAFAAACAPAPAPSDDERLQVTVSILPQKYFVERIGGQDVAVNVLVGPGESPHTYEPNPQQMRVLSTSELYFLIGVEFESAWMERITASNPSMRLVDLSANIEKIPVPAHGHADEELLEEDDKHENEYELDTHVWTSPRLVRIMSVKIAQELSALNPQRASYYQANLDAFLADIDQLEADIQTALRPLENRKFMVFHPAWGYFARDFDLEQIAIEVGGTEPSASELAALLDKAKHEGIRVIFAQPEFSTRSAEIIAREIGGAVILISPHAEDWLENMELFTRSLAENL